MDANEETRAPAFRPAQPPEVHGDHPFLFAIQHMPSGACLIIRRATGPL